MKKKNNKFVYILLAICFVGLLATSFELNIFACVLLGAGFVWLLKNGKEWFDGYMKKNKTESEEQKDIQK